MVMSPETAGTRLKRTHSHCQVCREFIPAEMVKRGIDKAEDVWTIKKYPHVVPKRLKFP